MGKINSRAKGARYERELARYLDENGFPARRGQQFAGGSDSPDVVCVIHRKKNSESMFTCRLSDLVALLNQKSWNENSGISKD